MIIAFPVFSGVIAVINELDPVAARLVQAAFMLLSLLPVLIYCQMKQLRKADLLLGKGAPAGFAAFYHGWPLLLVFLPALLTGLAFPDAALSLVTLFFTLTVGMAEELYFRGLILNFLRHSFRPGAAIALSALFFGFGHVAIAFTAPGLLMVALSVLGALIFGWLAAEAALLIQSILPLMLFHALFNFIDYHMAAQDTRLAIAYFARGAVMLALAFWLFLRRRRREAGES